MSLGLGLFCFSWDKKCFTETRARTSKISLGQEKMYLEKEKFCWD